MHPSNDNGYFNSIHDSTVTRRLSSLPASRQDAALVVKRRRLTRKPSATQFGWQATTGSP